MKISVYITSFNQKHYLIEAIESVLNQTLKPFEIIIVDDCSTDGSQGVIDGYFNSYPDLIIPIYHTQNQGVTQTRIDALQSATGDYVTYVDGDDRYLPSKLEKEANLLQKNPNVQIAFSNYYYITPEGNRFGIWADGVPPPQGNVFLQAFSRTFPKGSLFRNELIEYSCLTKVGFYDPKLQLYEDWDMKIRLTKHFKVAFNTEPLMEYRQNPEGLSRLPSSLHLKSMKRVYEKNSHFLDELPITDSAIIRKSLKIKFAHLAMMASAEECEKGNRILSVKYWLESLKYNFKNFNLRWPAQIILSQTVYSKVQTTYRSFRNILSLLG